METNNNLLSVLTREGVLINVSIRFWRGCKKLKPEDIGLDAADLSERLIVLGHKRLFPKDAIAALSLVESRAHALIESNSFPFLNGMAHYLPNTKLEQVTGKLRELETEFWQARQQFLDRYSSLRDNASSEWRAMAQKLLPDPDNLVATIEASFPLPEKISKYYGFDTQLFQISLPESMALEFTSAENQQELIQARHKAAQEAGAKIRRDTEIFVADCIASLREQTAQLCDEMLTSIQTSQTGVHQKTLNRLVHFIDEFKQMNFADDRIMEQQLERVRGELLTRTAEEYRHNDTAKASLVSGLSQLADQARQLARQDTTEMTERFGQLGRRRFHLAA